MCEPGGYSAPHILNPWMDWTEAVDARRALRQWSALADTIRDAGADVETIHNHSRSGAMTFTRDTAVVTAVGEAVVLRNVGRRGDLEPEQVIAWLRADGIEIIELDDDDRLDGGNVVPTSDGWLLGLAPGATIGTAQRLGARLADLTGAAVHGVPIADPKFGHLDTALGDLAGRGWLAYPAAFAQPDVAAASWEPILRGRPVIEVTAEEADALACNVIVIGDIVVGGLTPRLCREVERLGLGAVPVDLDEFRKAGGGAHCLTLELTPIHQRVAVPDHTAAAAAPTI